MVCMGVGLDRSKALAKDRTASSLKALFARSSDVNLLVRSQAEHRAVIPSKSVPSPVS